MVTQSSRQGLLLLFSILIVWVGAGMLNMSYFEVLFIASMAAIIVKLTDIQETIERLRK